ncbi:DUF7529 family protein [Natrinema salifodinae]|uniref:Uncharacterized protein n=1 Tax=Natrinema salifodinae TaxID=1202768 RepID=A0A1I0NJ81_9EURY|nr:hypothetical protein [Natrinema salifodinae]SEW01557.1 hypothetical protein SAMN05216285_1802 [Natrinema salifodinae]
MTGSGRSDDGTVEDAERRSGAGNARKVAWSRTLDDTDAIAEQRRDDGWDVVSIAAVDTAPMSREVGPDDRFGTVYVIPDNDADSFTDAYERGEFSRYEAYRNETEGYVYLVTELLDPNTETAILLAGQYQRRYADGMIAAAEEENVLYTHVETLDGTVLGSVRHEEYEPLLPDGSESKSG